MINGVVIITAWSVTYLAYHKDVFPRLFLYAYIETQKKNKKAPHNRHQTPSTEIPNPKNLAPKPQPPNQHKGAKMRNDPGK